MGTHTTTILSSQKGGDLIFPILQVISGEQAELQISLPEELAIFAHAVNNGDFAGRRDITVRLTADIDLTGFCWVPIGFGEVAFAGVFDGCGHTVRGMALQKDGPGNYGLFGAVSGTVQNLTVAGEIRNLTGDPHSAVGGIAGELSGGVVKNCAVRVTVDCRGEPFGFFAGGGVAGALLDSRMEDCSFDGTPTALAAGFALGAASYHWKEVD